jgi:enolase
VAAVVVGRAIRKNQPPSGRETLEASKFRVERIVSRKALDSRINPTVQVNLYTKNAVQRFSLPSGASKGHLEAHELRDGDKQRYNGQGIQKAQENTDNVLDPKIFFLSRIHGHSDRVQDVS